MCVTNISGTKVVLDQYFVSKIVPSLSEKAPNQFVIKLYETMHMLDKLFWNIVPEFSYISQQRLVFSIAKRVHYKTFLHLYKPPHHHLILGIFFYLHNCISKISQKCSHHKIFTFMYQYQQICVYSLGCKHCIIFQPLSHLQFKQSMKVSSSLKQPIFLSYHTHVYTHTHTTQSLHTRTHGVKTKVYFC